MLNAVEEIVAVVGPELLAADQLAAAFERFKGVFAMSEERRQERALRRSQEDFDEEEAEALQVCAGQDAALSCLWWQLHSGPFCSARRWNDLPARACAAAMTALCLFCKCSPTDQTMLGV